MADADDRPPTLPYWSADRRRGRPTGGDYSDVANGFLSAFVAVPLAAGLVMAGARADRLSLLGLSVAVAVVLGGVARGLRRGRWGFLLGTGLFVALVVAAVVVVRLVAMA